LINKISKVLAASLLVALAGMTSGGHAFAERVAEPDTIFQNGKIYLGVPGQFVQALAVKDGRVIATGSVAQMRALAVSTTTYEDLKGQTVLPGLYDNHVHVNADRGSEPKDSLDLSKITGLKDLQRLLKEQAARIPSGEWIVATVPHGTGSVEPFPESALPTRWDLDGVTPNHPVALTRGAHITLVNSKALQIAGISKDTPQPGGGVIERNDKGEPNGVLRESSARRMVMSHVPAPKLSDEEGMQNLRKRLRDQLALGVTSLNVPGMRPGTDLRLMQKLYEQEGDTLPRATIQIRLSPGFDSYDDPAKGAQKSIEEIESLSFRTGFGNDRIKLGAIKMSVDGGMGGQAAWLVDEYRTRPGYHGVERIPEDALYRVAKRADGLGWQLGIHAIGDQGIIRTVNVMERIVKENPRPDARHYLHHISVKPPDEVLRKIKDNHLLAAMQPNFTHTLASFYAMALSPQKLPTNNPLRSLKDLGIPISFGTDSLPDGPIIALYAAVTRRASTARCMVRRSA
jgi:predicted amidohydrolase YtcJ